MADFKSGELLMPNNLIDLGLLSFNSTYFGGKKTS